MTSATDRESNQGAAASSSQGRTLRQRTKRVDYRDDHPYREEFEDTKDGVATKSKRSK